MSAFVRNNLPTDDQSPEVSGRGHFDTKAGPEPGANTLTPPSPLPPTRNSMKISSGELAMGKGAKSPSV